MKREKCDIDKDTVRYLGWMILTKGNKMDDNKVEIVKNWSREKNTNRGRLKYHLEVQQILGFGNNYRHFIPKHAETAERLIRLYKAYTMSVGIRTAVDLPNYCECRYNSASSATFRSGKEGDYQNRCSPVCVCWAFMSVS